MIAHVKYSDFEDFIGKHDTGYFTHRTGARFYIDLKYFNGIARQVAIQNTTADGEPVMDAPVITLRSGAELN